MEVAREKFRIQRGTHEDHPEVRTIRQQISQDHHQKVTETYLTVDSCALTIRDLITAEFQVHQNIKVDHYFLVAIISKLNTS